MFWNGLTNQINKSKSIAVLNWVNHVQVCNYLVKQGALIAVKQKGQKSIRHWSKATWRDWTALHMAARHNKHEATCIAESCLWSKPRAFLSHIPLNTGSIYLKEG